MYYLFPNGNYGELITNRDTALINVGFDYIELISGTDLENKSSFRFQSFTETMYDGSVENQSNLCHLHFEHFLLNGRTVSQYVPERVQRPGVRMNIK